VQQTLEHDLRADELRQVVARLASLFAFALELAHLEAPADEIAEVDAPRGRTPPDFQTFRLRSG